MKFVEVSGKTKDEAITNAIVELGVPEEQVDIEVLSEGKGLFGLFGKSVKIRATLKEEIENEMERKPAKPAKAKEMPAAEKAESKKENKKENKKEAKPAKKEEKAEKPVEAEEPAKEETHTIEVEGLTVTGEKVIINDTIEQRLRKANANKKNEERSGEGHKKFDKQDRRPRDRKPQGEVEKEEAPVETKPVFEPKVFEIPEDADEVMTKTCTFVTELLSAMGIASTVTAKFSEDGIMEVDIAGEGMGLIIGKRGATLDSLQYLTTLVINKDRKDHVRLKLDTEGYRARRQETLEKLAINMAKKAKRTGHRVVLEPMNPYERRIIHSALQNESGVETHSDGEEPYRKVIISPKRRH